MPQNRLEAMRQVEVNLRSEGQTSRADMAELIAEIERLSAKVVVLEGAAHPCTEALAQKIERLQREHATLRQQVASEPAVLTDDPIRTLTRKAGGRFHRPNVEHVSMEEQAYFRMIRSLSALGSGRAVLELRDVLGQPATLQSGNPCCGAPRLRGSHRKVRAQIAQPAVVFPRELLNIRDRNMAMQLAITATSGKS